MNNSYQFRIKKKTKSRLHGVKEIKHPISHDSFFVYFSPSKKTKQKKSLTKVPNKVLASRFTTHHHFARQHLTCKRQTFPTILLLSMTASPLEERRKVCNKQAVYSYIKAPTPEDPTTFVARALLTRRCWRSSSEGRPCKLHERKFIFWLAIS